MKQTIAYFEGSAHDLKKLIDEPTIEIVPLNLRRNLHVNCTCHEKENWNRFSRKY